MLRIIDACSFMKKWRGVSGRMAFRDSGMKATSKGVAEYLAKHVEKL